MWIWVQMQQIDTRANLASIQANNSHAAIFRTTGTIAYTLFVWLPDQ